MLVLLELLVLVEMQEMQVPLVLQVLLEVVDPQAL